MACHYGMIYRHGHKHGMACPVYALWRVWHNIYMKYGMDYGMDYGMAYQRSHMACGLWHDPMA
jgi:hypothetical protein